MNHLFTAIGYIQTDIWTIYKWKIMAVHILYFNMFIYVRNFPSILQLTHRATMTHLHSILIYDLCFEKALIRKRIRATCYRHKVDLWRPSRYRRRPDDSDCYPTTWEIQISFAVDSPVHCCRYNCSSSAPPHRFRWCDLRRTPLR